MAVMKRQQANDKVSVVLANDHTQRVFESFADHIAVSTTRLVGELKMGYDDVKAALASLEKENLIQREAGGPGMDWFRLTEEGVLVAKLLNSLSGSSLKKLK